MNPPRQCPDCLERLGPCYWHAKALVGLAEPPDQYLDEQELEATMAGRLHGDGRRLDAYIVD